MALRRRSDGQRRGEIPLQPLGREFGKLGAACVLVQHGLEPRQQTRFGLSRRHVRPQSREHLHPAHTAVQHLVEAGKDLGGHRGGNPQ